MTSGNDRKMPRAALAIPQFRRASIGNKIRWGYGISLGIALVGTLAGLVIGDRYQQAAQQQLRAANQQGELLGDLLLAANRFEPRRNFLPVLRNPSRFAEAREDFEVRVDRVGQLLTQLSNESLQFQSRSEFDLERFLNGYDRVFQNYVQAQRSLLDEIEPLGRTSEGAREAEARLLAFGDRPAAVTFARFSEEIATPIAAADRQIQAAEAAFQTANRWRRRIILGSLLLSMAIAAAFAFETGRAIARPIRTVTDVARQVTETGNFQIRVPELSEDEIGSLAQSLNQLVEWIEEYTRELQQTQAQLIQTEKMSSLGQMVAGIAHEINNPVNFIYGNLPHVTDYIEELMALLALYDAETPDKSPDLEVALEESDLEFMQEDLPRLLQSMRVGADRIRQLVLSLRNFSRLDESQNKASDLHEGLESTLLLLSNRLKRGFSVVRDYGELPMVECYPAQLNQVFMNLLSNAIDALSEQPENPDKEIQIQTRSRDREVSIRIYDNGPGIPEAVREKIFDPFFTTKGVGKGTGLGLSICYQIVEKHRGCIELESKPDWGTAFCIRLPQRFDDPPCDRARPAERIPAAMQDSGGSRA